MSELLSRVQSQLGMEIEVLDSRLEMIYPSADGVMVRTARESAQVRDALLRAIDTGRAQEVEGGGGTYVLQPLRRPGGPRQPVGVMARRRDRAGAPNLDGESWAELAHALIELDLAALNMADGLRQRSLRLSAALAFLEHLLTAADAGAVARALVQAAAVWLDADARIYRRDPGGDYVLHTKLPGADVPERARRLRNGVIEAAPGTIRAISSGEIVEGAPSAVYVVPLATTAEIDWFLMLGAPLEAIDASVMKVVARVAGIRLETLAQDAKEHMRTEMALAVQIDGRPSEVVCLDTLATLLGGVGAAAGSLWLVDRGQSRRLASLGSRPIESSPPPSEPPSESSFAADRIAMRLPLGVDVAAWLEVSAAAGTELRADAASLLRGSATVLQAWLSGTALPLRQAPLTIDVPVLQPFFSRLEEELALAMRLDRRLALVLVDLGAAVPSEANTVNRLQDELRRELRGSDVLGRMEGHQLAALLIETDAQGLGAVAHRLKRRLVQTAEALNLTTVTIGHAALSPACRTAEALVGHARRHAEPVVIH
jgi:hypothetical protein